MRKLSILLGRVCKLLAVVSKATQGTRGTREVA